MSKILALDPGESTGWVVGEGTVVVDGGTLGKNHVHVAELILMLKPDIVVMERFNLFPGKAQSLSWNSFYPVEVIGVIKYICMCQEIALVEQAPSIKKYAGGFGDDWTDFRNRKGCSLKITEHVKDAYQHWKYFIRNHREQES